MVPRFSRRRVLELAGAATALAAVRPGTAGAASFSRSVPLTGAPQRVPRFDLIGLDFGRAAHVHAEVRARLGDGRWTPWTAVHHATQPVWTGPADTFQVRHTGVARSLRANLTRTGPAPRVLAGASRRRQRSTGQPEIIPRSEWGGDALPPKEVPTFGTVQVGFVHHTVTANAYGPEDSASIILGICRYHRDHNGWSDIGYNFLVDKYGQIFEGREGGIELAVIGAQAQGYNSTSTGVSCLGDYTSAPLSADGIEAVSQLLAWKLSLHGVPVRGKVTVVSQGGPTNRYAAGRKVTLQRISGHRDGDATSCPGSALYAQLPAIRSRAAKLATALSGLTIAAAETELTYPDNGVSLTGRLQLAGDTGLSAAAQPVSIEYQTGRGQPWTPVLTATTDAAGAFSAAFPLGASGRVRAVAAGLSSTPITVVLLPRLSVKARRHRITARVEPATITDGEYLIQRRVGRRWVKVRRRRLRFRGGVARFRPHVKRAGRYRVTVRTGGAAKRRRLTVPS